MRLGEAIREHRLHRPLLVLLLLLIAISGWRIVRQHQIPGPFDPSRQGFCDFHNGVYFPSLAFAQRISPYSQEYAQTFPVERSIPFFSPAALAFHLPFSWLPLPVAEVVYFGWMITLVMAISLVVARWVSMSQHHAQDSHAYWSLAMLLAIGIVVSRGGQQTLFTGYFTFELILASLVAVHYSGQRPIVSGLALAWVAFKPNYILPIGLLLLSRGHWRSLCIGAALSIASAVTSFAWIAPVGGVEELLAQIQQTQEIHRLDEIERPANNWTRIDLLAVVAKWTGSDPSMSVYLASMLLLITPVAGVIAYRRQLLSRRPLNPCLEANGQGTVQPLVVVPFERTEDSALGLQGSLILLTSLICVYHHVYDSLLMLGAVAALCVGPTKDWRGLKWGWRAIVMACLAFPSLNYLSSQKLLQSLAIEGIAFQIITSLNAIALMIAWCIMLRALASQRSDESI